MSDEKKPGVSDSDSLKASDTGKSSETQSQATASLTVTESATTEGKSRPKSPASRNRKSDAPQHDPSVSLELKTLTQYQRVMSLAELRQEIERPDAANWTLEAIDFRLEFLESVWQKFLSVHENLEENCTAAFLTHDYVVFGTYSKAYRPYQEARLALNQLKQKLKASQESSQRSDNESSSSGSTRQRLPELPLPKFSGEYSQWVPYRDLFSSMVRNNNNISDVEKLHYLRTSLSGSAAQLIANIPVSAKSFQDAWSHLTERYDNKRFLLRAHLDKLFGDCSPVSRTADGLNQLIDSTTDALDALKGLGAPVEHWDHVIVHHLVRRLDNSIRVSWEETLGKSTEFPSYVQLKEYLIGRARALESIQDGKTPSLPPPRSVTPSTSRPALKTQTARSYAAATADPGFPCSMCQSSHFMVVCPRFRALSQKARRELVVQKRLCFNCLGPHHASSCQSTKRCRDCGGKHHTMIHVGAPGQSSQQSSAGTSNAPSTSSSK